MAAGPSLGSSRIQKSFFFLHYFLSLKQIWEAPQSILELESVSRLCSLFRLQGNAGTSVAFWWQVTAVAVLRWGNARPQRVECLNLARAKVGNVYSTLYESTVTYGADTSGA